MGKSTWDGLDNVGENLREATYKAWADSEMKKAQGKSGWLGFAGNELLDAAAFMMDGASMNNSPYRSRYEILERAKKRGPNYDLDTVKLIQEGRLPGDR